MTSARGSRLDTALRSGSPFLVYGAQMATVDVLDALVELAGPFQALDLRDADALTPVELTDRARASISASGVLVALLGDRVPHAVEAVLQAVVDGQVRVNGLPGDARPRLVVVMRSDLPRGRISDLLDVRLFADTALQASVPRRAGVAR